MREFIMLFRRSSVLALSTALLSIGCSSDPASSPEDEAVSESFTLQTTDTVGTAGGSIEAPGLSLTIPAGAFSGPTELRLYASDSDEPFGNNGVTKTYRIDGLPDDLTQPLGIALQYDGSLSDSSFIGFGRLAGHPFSGDSSTAYNLIAASDSSGYLVGELPPPTGNSPSGQPRATLSTDEAADDTAGDFLKGLTGYATITTEHFMINFPIYVTAYADDLARILEESYSTIKIDLGLREIDSYGWPLKVNVRETKETGSAALGDFFAGIFMEVNAAHLNQADLGKLQEGIGSELFYAVQLSYDGKSSYDQTSHLWWHRAVFEWSSAIFTANSAYIRPDSFPGHEMAPFKGMRAGAEQDKSHGIGMAAMVKYLVDTSIYGFGGLDETYNMIGNESTPMDPTAALLNSVNALVAEWWPDFIRKYVGGEIYGVGKAVFTNSANLSGAWTLDDFNDTRKLFSSTDQSVGAYPDLSAKLFMINLNYPSIDPTALMDISVAGGIGTEPISLIVFGIQNGPLIYLGHTEGQSEPFQIPNLKGYIDDGWTQFLVVVVNSDFDSELEIPYTGNSSIDLQVDVAIPLPYNRCVIQVDVFGNFKRVTDGVTANVTETREFPSMFVTGSFAGNTFTGSYSVDNTPFDVRNGTVMAILNESRTMITHVEWSETFQNDYFGTASTTSFEGTDIPLIPDLPTPTFQILGEEVCNQQIITSLEWHWTQKGPEGSIALVIDLLAANCNDQSQVWIKFWEE